VVTIPANVFVGFATLFFQWVFVHCNFSLYNWKQITNYNQHYPGWWLNQPIENIGSSKCTIFPNFRGENSKKNMSETATTNKTPTFQFNHLGFKKNLSTTSKMFNLFVFVLPPFQG